MEASRHMVVPEIDLSACSPASIVDRFVEVPALKTSAAFLTFLRANLVLNASAMSSQTSTPLLEPIQQFHRTPSPSPLTSNPPLIPEDDIPDLSLETLHDDGAKVEALHLVADSIAQQRQTAALSVVSHPLGLAGLAACLAISYRYGMYSRNDPGMTVMLCCGVTMIYLLGIRYLTSGYLRKAESLGWPWLRNDEGENDIIIGTKFGGELIGALVLRLEPSQGTTHSSKRRGRNGAFRGGKGVIRAWTTSLRYRGKGVGTDMLDEAVRLTREKCGRDAEVGFAKEHANSEMVLPEMFNGPFKRRERKATQALNEAVESWEAAKKKRRTASM